MLTKLPDLNLHRPCLTLEPLRNDEVGLAKVHPLLNLRGFATTICSSLVLHRRVFPHRVIKPDPALYASAPISVRCCSIPGRCSEDSDGKFVEQ